MQIQCVLNHIVLFKGLHWFGNVQERDHVEDLGIEGRVVLKWVLRKYV